MSFTSSTVSLLALKYCFGLLYEITNLLFYDILVFILTNQLFGISKQIIDKEKGKAMKKIITKKMIKGFKAHLYVEEKAKATIQKYITDLNKLVQFAAGREISKMLMISYKEYLIERKYEASSINSFLAAANSFFDYAEWYGFRVKPLKIQKQSFSTGEKDLSKEEYRALVKAARKKGKNRLAMMITTICCTGIRVSELSFLTVEGVKKGMIEVNNKGKRRKVLLPQKLKKSLLLYIADEKICGGAVFCTASGKPVNRSNIWREMKTLCSQANVNADKVFPHNLRHLFAKEFYALEKDIAKLADLLGHANIETTRIYVRTGREEYIKQLNEMNLVGELII